MPTINKTHTGIPVIIIPTKSLNGHLILHFPIGSRNENIQKHGLMHALEHMLFKGTKNKDYYNLINSIENLGGDINAYTTKENMVIHVSYPNRYISQITQLMSEIIYESVFPGEELKKEKNVIIDEIRTYRDSPSEFIYDELERIIFRRHPLGHDILGSIASVNRIQTKDLQNCMNTIQKHIHLAIISNLEKDKVMNIINKNFYSKYEEPITEQFSIKESAFDKTIIDDLSQTHYISGILTNGYLHNEQQSLLLLSSMLGGNSMGALLNMELREKYGLSYTIESSLSSYKECGFLYHYLTCDHKKLNKSISLMHKAFENIRKNNFTNVQITHSKNYLSSQYSIYFEQPLHEALFHAKYYQYNKQCISISEWIKSMNKISSDDLYNTAMKYLDPAKYYSITIKKEK